MVSEFGVAPSEYWNMSPNEVFIVLENKRPKKIGNLHEDQLERLHARRAQAERDGVNVI
jgi:hypothetical protein